jgi:hypothetical protein
LQAIRADIAAGEVAAQANKERRITQLRELLERLAPDIVRVHMKEPK